MDERGHHLEKGADKHLRCTRCLREWVHAAVGVAALVSWCALVRRWLRSGGPAYVLAIEAARTQTAKRGAPDGCIVTSYRELVYLYAIDQAPPRRSETEKQRAVRLAAWPDIQEKYKCEHCGYVPVSLAAIRYEMSSPGLCLGCKERLEWQVEQQDALNAQIAEDRRGMCSRAYQLLQRADWAMIDTKTTSLTGVLYEIAVATGDGTILFHSLVNPERPVSAEARVVHGISDEELATARQILWHWSRKLSYGRKRGAVPPSQALQGDRRVAASPGRQASDRNYLCDMG